MEETVLHNLPRLIVDLVPSVSATPPAIQMKMFFIIACDFKLFQFMIMEEKAIATIALA